eukprot:TRINITY_DN17516_c0_g1_i3.p2 TRINITY_DN17516_c0_g1~~TRINITY_DN17516_c0_g1_i3.p2  ORF type:complete len:193 (+),score=45.19 TRINITY_DN17516_c0_g1_i3:216-794(+)
MRLVPRDLAEPTPHEAAEFHTCTPLDGFLWRAIGPRLQLSAGEVEQHLSLLDGLGLRTIGSLQGLSDQQWRAIEMPFEIKRMLRFSILAAAPDCCSDQLFFEEMPSESPPLESSMDYPVDVTEMPADAELNLKDQRDLDFLRRVLPVERRTTWKRVEWCEGLSQGLIRGTVEQKPVLCHLRANLFGELGGEA